jgi:hypothetical protein
MAPRQRKPGNEWMAQYPGLYVNRNGTYRVLHPVTKKFGSLETKDRTTAIRRWSILNERWEAEARDWKSKALADRLGALSVPKSEGDNIHLSDYLVHWRTNILGHQVSKDGRVTWNDCLVLSMRGHNRGKPIAMPTRIDYASDCRQLEDQEGARFALSDPTLLKRVRKLLAPWLTKPTHYNGLRNTLSRVFAHAVQEGIIDRNPMIDISKATISKREVLVPDDAYTAITEKLCTHKINRRKLDGTWRAKICDMIYMMSQQPIDVFGLREDQVELFDAPRRTEVKDINGAILEEYEVFGLITMRRHKTNIGIEIEMNEDMAALVTWFQDFKRRESIVSPYLMVYPRYFDKRSRGKPVAHRFMQLAWKQAAEEAGYSGMYQLRDLRKKGLTDEFINQGENDKGGHETEAMRKHYRLITPPKRARSTLKFIKSGTGNGG